MLAKGLENAARRNLSFYEKARFAEAIQAAGYDGATVRQVLNLSASGQSHLTKVTQNVPVKIGDLIGAAPKSGRPRWTELAELFLSRKLAERAALDILAKISATANSDERLELLIKEATKRGAKTSSGTREITPLEGVTIKAGRATLSLSVKKSGTSAEFATWLESNLAEIIKKSYAEFAGVKSVDDN